MMMSTTATSLVPDPSSPAWSIYVDNQIFNLTAVNGQPVSLSLTEINDLALFGLREVALQSFTIGATGVTIIVLLIHWDSKKVRKPLYIINLLGPIILCVQNILSVSMLCQTYNYGVGENILGSAAQYSQASAWGAAFVLFFLLL